MMGRSATALCNECADNQDHTHTPSYAMFYQCVNINPLFQWLLRVLFNVCKFKPTSNIRFLYFDNRYDNFSQIYMQHIYFYLHLHFNYMENEKRKFKNRDFKKHYSKANI